MLEKIMNVLTERRMMSVGNLALHFEMEPEGLQPRLDQLESAGRIRYAIPRCSGACSTCSSCPSGEGDEEHFEPPPVDPTAIVISLALKHAE